MNYFQPTENIDKFSALFALDIPSREDIMRRTRKPSARGTVRFKDKTKYSRHNKHGRGQWD